METVTFAYNGSNECVATVNGAQVGTKYHFQADDPDSSGVEVIATVDPTLLTISDIGGLAADEVFFCFVDNHTIGPSNGERYGMTAFTFGPTTEYPFVVTWDYDGIDTVTAVVPNSVLGVDYEVDCFGTTSEFGSTVAGTGGTITVTCLLTDPPSMVGGFTGQLYSTASDLSCRLFSSGSAGAGLPGNPTSIPGGGIVPPLWRNFVADLAGQGITDYSKLTSDRAVEVILNGPLSAGGTVPSDNPQVWIPYTDDGYDDPYLSEGTRLMWWFRKESNTPPYYTVRGATIVQLVADEAQQDDARTRFVGWDPWHYMFSRPVQTFTGDLPGPDGLSFTATQAATVIETLLDNTFQNDGHIYIDLPDLKPDLTVNSGASGFWSGTIETGAGMEIDINFAQNTSVGQALQQVCNMGVCDIILNPIYDPTDRPNFLVELNVYAQAGVTRDEAIFAWNAPGRSLVGLSRTEDGSSRANKMVFFAGQGGASGVTAVTQDAASQAKYGVYFAQQFFPGQVDLNAVSDLVDQQLALRKNGKTTVMIRPAPERSPRPWQDYGLGDRVPTWALPQGFRKLLG